MPFDPTMPAVQQARDNGLAVYEQLGDYWLVELRTWKASKLPERQPAWLSGPEIIRWAAAQITIKAAD